MDQRGTPRATAARGEWGASRYGAGRWDARPAVDRERAVPRDDGAVLVDCDTCSVRGPGCADCVVTVLLGMPAPPLRIGGEQVQALGVLARSGLVPPLRHDRAG